MKLKNVRYRWQYWSLFKSFDYTDYPGAGGTERIFTINPKFLWDKIRRHLKF